MTPGWTPPALPAQWAWTANLPPWVGRRRELDQLEGIWEAVEHGVRQVVFVAGEAGAGKSRLVTEVAWALHSRGVPVLVGQCTSDGGLPFDPLVAPARALLAAVDRGELELGDREAVPAHEARRLLALITSGVTSEASPAAIASVALSAVVSALAGACAHGPLVVVLEDVHWARESGLRAVRHLVERTADLPLLVLITQRDTPPDATDDLSTLAADLMRLPGVHRFDLGGLDTAEVGSYLTALHAGDASTVRQGAALLHDRTGGNPFLLGEVWRELRHHGGLDRLAAGQVSVPGSLKALVRQRLGRLDPADRVFLCRGAVIGEVFGVELVHAAGAAPDEPPARVYAALTAASAAGLVEQVPGRLGRYRFRHALARQAVLAEMDPYALASEHAAVGFALERSTDAHDPAGLPALAHHFSQAVGLGLEGRAAHYLEESATLAATRLAHSDAATLFEHAAALTPGGRDRDRLVLRAARSHLVAGNLQRARALADIVAASADPHLRLEAAVDYEATSWRTGLDSSRSVLLLTDALADSALDPSDPGRLRAEAARGRALVRSGRNDEGRELLERTLARARVLGLEQLLVDVLERCITLNTHASGSAWIDRLRGDGDLAAEVTALARRRGDLRPVGVASQMRAFAAYILGEPGEFRSALDDLGLVARVTHEPYWRWREGVLLASWHVVRGEFAAAAERLAEARARAAAFGEAWLDMDGPGSLQAFLLRRETGRLEFARSILEAGGGPERPWLPGLVALYSELGMAGRARAALHQALLGDLALLRDPPTAPAALSFLGEAAIRFSDAAAAEALVAEAEVYSGLNLMGAEFLAPLGSAHRLLAGLTAVLGRPGVEDHFAAALEMDTRMDAPLHVATTHAAWAAWLRTRGVRDARLAEHADAARALADRYGLVRVRRILGEGDARGAGGAEGRGGSGAGGHGPGGMGAAAAASDGLTGREIEVLRLIGQGRSNREIARALYISEHTAANHVRSILMKTQSGNRTAAARYAMRHGLLGDDPASDDRRP